VTAAGAADPPDGGAESTPAAMSGRISPVSERRRSLRVLLVDDNSASQQAMRRIITNAGMLCDLAGNGKVRRCRLNRRNHFETKRLNPLSGITAP
jgi:PleD family two-component response regulator